MGKCSKYTALIIKYRSARLRKKRDYYRRRLREHVRGCWYCQRGGVERVPVSYGKNPK